ncbi:hypothetical protein [Pseudoxanthomonas putridarboris]|uniref:hypothetical protein n=1 Tax=Pseudoxanthomonas putridarboris TaxID=752605 RepID=UPI00311E2580
MINLPAAIENQNPPLNGLVDRYHAFAYAQALLYESPAFPDAQGQMQWRPDDYAIKELP